MFRWVLYSDELGIFLGTCLGLGFWSKLDAVGQDSACTFESESQALDYIAKQQEMLTDAVDIRPVKVLVEHDRYATVSECVLAGLPGWDARI